MTHQEMELRIKELEKQVKALEQEPCPNAISRSDMLDAVGHGTTYTSEELQKIIKGLPSVNPQPCENAISRQAVLDIVDSYSESKSNVEDVTQDIISDIVALPPVNPQPCDDAISRQAVLEAVSRIGLCKCNTNEIEAVDECLRSVKDLPPVSPQPKTGHWISFEVQGEVDGQIVETFTCSECSAISIFRVASGNIVNGDLCPNCGAKMIEPQESGGKE